MGSFNVSCHLSGLSIREGDKVKLLFINEFERSPGNLWYSYDTHQVLTFPLDATYDDYGKYKWDEKCPIYRHLLKFLQENCQKVSVGEHPRRDIEVTPSKLNMDMLVKSVYSGRLSLRGLGDAGKISFFPVLSEVYGRVISSVMKDSIDNLICRKTYSDKAFECLPKLDGKCEEIKKWIMLNIPIPSQYFHDQCMVSELHDIVGSDSFCDLVAEMAMLYETMSRNNIMFTPRMTAGQVVNYRDTIEFNNMCNEIAKKKTKEWEIPFE